MLDRQTTWIDDEGEEEDEDEGKEEEKGEENNHDAEDNSEKESLNLSSLRDSLNAQDATAGFCGRCGKMADTCYCFWNVGALAVSTRKAVGVGSSI